MKASVLKDVIKKSGEPFPKYLEHQVLSWGHLVPRGETVTGTDLALLIWSSQMREIEKKSFGSVPWLSRVIISYHLFLYMEGRIEVTRTKKAGITYRLKGTENGIGNKDPSDSPSAELGGINPTGADRDGERQAGRDVLQEQQVGV